MFIGPGKRALAVAKQLAFDQVLRQGPAIDGHQRHLRPQTPVMYGPGSQLFARAGFTQDQDGRVGGSDPGDQREDSSHRRGIANQVRFSLEPLQPLLHRPVLVRQFALFGDALQYALQLGQPAGFGEVVKNALAERSHRRFQGRLAGQDNRLGVAGKFLGPGDDLDPAQARHVEIHKEAVIAVPLQCGHGGQTVGTDRRVMPHAR